MVIIWTRWSNWGWDILNRTLIDINVNFIEIGSRWGCRLKQDSSILSIKLNIIIDDYTGEGYHKLSGNNDIPRLARSNSWVGGHIHEISKVGGVLDDDLVQCETVSWTICLNLNGKGLAIVEWTWGLSESALTIETKWNWRLNTIEELDSISWYIGLIDLSWYTDNWIQLVTGLNIDKVLFHEKKGIGWERYVWEQILWRCLVLVLTIEILCIGIEGCLHRDIIEWNISAWLWIIWEILELGDWYWDLKILVSVVKVDETEGGKIWLLVLTTRLEET